MLERISLYDMNRKVIHKKLEKLREIIYYHRGRAPGWAPGSRRERARVPEDQGRPGDPWDTKSRASGLCLRLVALKAEATAKRAKIWP